MELATIILAAGKGKRMKSDLPKVLHQLNGRPMVHYVIDAAEAIGSNKIVLIVGHKKEMVIESCRDRKVEYITQEEQLGTGHAVLQTAPLFDNFKGNILVLSGDVPLLTPRTLNSLIEIHQNQNPLASLLTAEMDDPTGYGRIVRDGAGFVNKIVEHKDADPETLRIREINVGIYIFESDQLFRTLPLLSDDNSQGEYYLPDVVKIYVDRGEKVAAVLTPDVEETHGINDVYQLRRAEQILNSRLMMNS
ncbi:MAG: sugar phosphate nucleotidyltransferase [Calditrichota bacterium]|jgi:UDP-N-acetylglucosamine diphosphorylase/glucosamine-1-phosphate N-acetyltransferase